MWQEAEVPTFSSVKDRTLPGHLFLSTEKGKPASKSEDNKDTGDQPFQLRPGRSQKQRSKLQQTADESDLTPAAAEPAPAAPAISPPRIEEAPSLRRVRLKRSGQQRSDRLLPNDGAPKPPDDLY